jgi:hypothetical protein
MTEQRYHTMLDDVPEATQSKPIGLLQMCLKRMGDRAAGYFASNDFKA